MLISRWVEGFINWSFAALHSQCLMRITQYLFLSNAQTMPWVDQLNYFLYNYNWILYFFKCIMLIYNRSAFKCKVNKHKLYELIKIINIIGWETSPFFHFLAAGLMFLKIFFLKNVIDWINHYHLIAMYLFFIFIFFLQYFGESKAGEWMNEWLNASASQQQPSWEN